MMSAIEQANLQQLAASDPDVSSFVAASAGSGKTKLLTDRLLRLMLAGSAPEKILCLTYTKAAAAEMRIRLNRRLGEWVTMPHEALSARLRDLNIKPDQKTLKRARELFADVLDLPGGMQIETIHAFCQSLLRRFPLEARISPHFVVANDEDALQRLRESREAILADPAMKRAIEVVAAEVDEQRFIDVSSQFVSSVSPDFLQKNSKVINELLQQVLAVKDVDEADLQTGYATPPREIVLRDYLRQVAESGTPTGQKWAHQGLDWLTLDKEQRILQKNLWQSTLFTKAGEILKLSQHFGKMKDKADAIKAEITREAERILLVEEQLKRLNLVKINQALLDILIPIAKVEQQAKGLESELSYADLIEQTSKLLIDPGAAWVLYKLDGGIEHLLLDEVQDTAPEQWKIANAIAAEFFAGLGARDEPRSIFAVGDPKQSIFSFQGADLKSFETYREKFKDSVIEAKQQWLDGALSVSFRSTAPVLALTDAVFAAGFARQGVLNPTEILRHGVSRAGQAGRVTLWPLTKNAEITDLPEWDTPDDYQEAESAVASLARMIGEYIYERLRHPLPARNRLAMPGDFLILVRSRGPIVGALTSELKARGIEVAGLDRMVLPEQPVISDMLALCDSLLLPEDDLAFAQFLVSPLGGLSDESLMELAINRQGTLAAALHARADERQEWQDARMFYETLSKRVDFDTPFALLSEALGQLGGRARLLLRFGAEAAEPLDEFLSEALNYALKEPSGLQNFVQHLRLSGQEIKREAEAGGNEVRIMTVHGAKGLQAPIVILPDTVSLPKAEFGLSWMSLPDADFKIPIFCPRTELRVEPLQQQQDELRQMQIEEYNRLLYVALTRAEDEVLICGAKGKREIPENCWYEAVKAGFLRLMPRVQEDGNLVYDCPQSVKPDNESKAAPKKMAQLPDWAGEAPNWQATLPGKDQTKPERITPSRSTEEKSRMTLAISPLVTAREVGGTRAAAMARGTAIHALLQYLPELPIDEREQAALAYLVAQPDLRAESQKIYLSVLKILHDPVLEKLFGPGSGAEIPLTAVVKDREISGEADRIFVGPEEIIIADYKTDKNPPADAGLIPEKYLFQLAAYRAVLQQIYPGRRVTCVLIWTEKALAMTVPDALFETVGLG